MNHPAHPDIAWTTDRIDAVEIWNVGWAFPFVKPTTRARIDRLLEERGLAGVPGSLSAELADALTERSGGFNAQSLRFWEAHLARGARLAAVGGGDRHVLLAPGYPTTWVRAPDRAVPSLLAAIRAGRTVVTRSPLVRPPEVTVRSGSTTAGIGDEVPAGAPLVVSVRAVVARRGLVVIYRGREPIAAIPVTREQPLAEVRDTPAGPTWYRVEVLEPLIRGIAPRLPTFRMPDPVNRAINADPKRPGWCKTAITSAVFVRSACAAER